LRIPFAAAPAPTEAKVFCLERVTGEDSKRSDFDLGQDLVLLGRTSPTTLR
jgi:hypothetical protein